MRHEDETDGADGGGRTSEKIADAVRAAETPNRAGIRKQKES